jgi:hydrogenase maturation protease
MDAVGAVKTCLVIGYGNTLRGDDGLGPHVAEGLQGVVSAYGRLLDVRIMALPQLDVVLACQMAEADVVIFVDARVDDSEELVKIRRIEPAADLGGQLQTSHTISSMPALLRIAFDWYRAAPLCYAVMPKGYDFSVGETMSAKARIAATHARTKIIEILGQQIKTKEPECNLSQG